MKSGFVNTRAHAYGAVECMYTALHDLAEPKTDELGTLDTSKNPESYAWFGVAKYLSIHGTAHQDWSSGGCRNEGSPAEIVTVSRAPNVPRQTSI